MLAAITAILYYQFASRPKAVHSYSTDDPYDNRRGGLMHTCGCSLPANLGDPENPSKKTTSNVCYDPSKVVEGVTILMYPNSTKQIIDEIIAETPSKSLISNRTEDGFFVTQAAHDLTFPENHPNKSEIEKLLAPVYLSGGPYKEWPIYEPMKYVLSENFVDFPNAYTRISWIYDCSNILVCNQTSVEKLGKDIVPRDIWVSCLSYEADINMIDTTNQLYTARCVLYPPDSLAAISAVKRFIFSFLQIPEISNIRVIWPPDQKVENDNYTRFEPNILYLNISHAVSQPVQLSFMEVDKSSTRWIKPLEKFPTLEKKCADLSPVMVCNNTSVCDMFKTSPTYDLKSYDLRCVDFTEHQQCQDWVQTEGLILNNLGSSTADWKDILCPPALNCSMTSAPYSVVWSTSEDMQNDPLNSFLASNKLRNEWAQISGVCSITYDKVISNPGPADLNDGETIYMQSNCKEATETQPSYCWLTGLYHNLSDKPGVNWTRLPDIKLFQSPGKRFVCYRVQEQAFMLWFVFSFGAVLGWIGSIQLFLYGAFDWIFVPVRRFFVNIHSKSEKCLMYCTLTVAVVSVYKEPDAPS